MTNRLYINSKHFIPWYNVITGCLMLASITTCSNPNRFVYDFGRAATPVGHQVEPEIWMIWPTRPSDWESPSPKKTTWNRKCCIGIKSFWFGSTTITQIISWSDCIHQSMLKQLKHDEGRATGCRYCHFYPVVHVDFSPSKGMCSHTHQRS